MDVINTNPNMPDYFRSSSDREGDKRIYNKFSDVFLVIGFFEGMFRLKVKGAADHT